MIIVNNLSEFWNAETETWVADLDAATEFDNKDYPLPKTGFWTLKAKLPVFAEITTDDNLFSVKFNATPMFNFYNDQEVYIILQSKNDYPLDRLAWDASGFDNGVKEALDHGNVVGFEVAVVPSVLSNWIRYNRPQLNKRLKRLNESNNFNIEE